MGAIVKQDEQLVRLDLGDRGVFAPVALRPHQIPESGAFWPPQVPPNTVLTGFFGALQSSANC
jgi:hypothetical protein